MFWHLCCHTTRPHLPINSRFATDHVLLLFIRYHAAERAGRVSRPFVSPVTWTFSAVLPVACESGFRSWQIPFTWECPNGENRSVMDIWVVDGVDPGIVPRRQNHRL